MSEDSKTWLLRAWNGDKRSQVEVCANVEDGFFTIGDESIDGATLTTQEVVALRQDLEDFLRARWEVLGLGDAGKAPSSDLERLVAGAAQRGIIVEIGRDEGDWWIRLHANGWRIAKEASGPDLDTVVAAATAQLAAEPNEMRGGGTS